MMIHKTHHLEMLKHMVSGNRRWFLPFLVSSLLFAIMAGLMACDTKSKSTDFVRVSEPGYTGLVRCAECHTNNYAEWKQSLHSVAMTIPTDSTVVGSFNQASRSYGGVTSRMFKRDGQFFMETQGPDGQVNAYRVDYTIGMRQHQAYLTQLDNGRYQVLPLYHDGPKNAWVDAQEGGVVEQHQPLRRDDFYYWTNAGRTWNFHCFDCHASRVEKHYDAKTHRYQSSVGSLSIDCEACHGPSEKHDQTRGTMGEPLHLIELEKLGKEQAVEVCAQCHAAKEIVATGYLPGQDFYDYYQVILPDDEKVFFPDGQPRVYLYPGALHLMSPCFTHDDLRCTTCHDSHGNGRSVDLIADREGVELCESCHEDVAKNPVAHGHHKPGSKGNQCVQCHMPYHYVTGEHLTDHRIVSPVPQNTVENGVPNACNQSGCHADQSAQWASQWATNWYGNYQDAVVVRTTAVAQAQRKDHKALPVLLDMTEDLNAVWRATAAALLGRLGASQAVPRLSVLLTDAHPMVRLKAVMALGQIGDLRALSLLLSALSDSSLSVRIQVPFALMDMGYVPGDADAKRVLDQVLSEHRAVVYGVQSDDPGFRESLAQIYERQGQFEEAEREFDMVAQLDPRHPETTGDLARLKTKRSHFDMLYKHLSSNTTPHAQARFGVLLLKSGRYQEAQDIFSNIKDKSALLWTMTGDARLGSGDGDGAKVAYLHALEVQPGFRSAVRRMAQMILAKPGLSTRMDMAATRSAQEWTARGIVAFRAGDDRESAQAFVQALDAESTGDVATGLGREGLYRVQIQADSMIARGRTLYASGDLKGALAFYEQAIQLYPEHEEVYAIYGLIFADLGDLKAAEQQLVDALLIDPGNASALTLLGTVYQDKGLLKEAMGLYQQAWMLDQNAPGLAFLMGQLYVMQGNKDSAQTMLRRVIQREPENAQARDLLKQLGDREL